MVPPGRIRTYSAAAIINSWAQMDEGKAPQIDPKEFAGKIVLLGANAPGLLDLRPTPFSPNGSGTEIQAAALDNLLHKDFIRITPLAVLFLYMLALALLTAVGVSYSMKIWKIAVFFAACLALPAAASALAFRGGYLARFRRPGGGHPRELHRRRPPQLQPRRTPAPVHQKRFPPLLEP